MRRLATPRVWFPAPAAVVLLVALFLPLVARADPRVEARRHFKNGMALIADGKYDDGISELLEAYAIKPHPNVLFNVAKAYEAAGRQQEALDYYRRYLDANPPDSGPVKEKVEKLEAALPKPEVKPEVTPAAPQVDDAALARLAALADRLERAVERAEAREEALPAPGLEAEKHAVAGEPTDFAVP